MMCGQYPAQLALHFAVWSRPALRALVRTTFDVTLSVRAVGDYCARWGYTLRKALRRAYEQDETEVQQWLQTEFPTIRARAKREGG